MQHLMQRSMQRIARRQNGTIHSGCAVHNLTALHDRQKSGRCKVRTPLGCLLTKAQHTTHHILLLLYVAQHTVQVPPVHCACNNAWITAKKHIAFYAAQYCQRCTSISHVVTSESWLIASGTPHRNENMTCRDFQYSTTTALSTCWWNSNA